MISSSVTLSCYFTYHVILGISSPVSLSMLLKLNQGKFSTLPANSQPPAELPLCWVDGGFWNRSQYLMQEQIFRRLHYSDTHLSFMSKIQCTVKSTKSSSDLSISSSPLWSQISPLSDLLQWPSTWISAHIVNLSKLDVIQWFSNLIKMQIWPSFILLQVLHGSEDKGKTNLIRTMEA